MSYFERGESYSVTLEDGTVITNPEQFREHDALSGQVRPIFEGEEIFSVVLEDGFVATNPREIEEHRSRPPFCPESLSQ